MQKPCSARTTVYKHTGVDLKGVSARLVNKKQGGDKQGASTLQCARRMTWVSAKTQRGRRRTKDTPERKLSEIT